MNPQDLDNPFATEYAHLHEWVTEAETRLQELNQEMSRASDAPAPRLTPPDPFGNSGVAQTSRSRVDIQHDKDETKANAYKRVEKETETAEPSLKHDTRDIAFGRLYQEDIEKLNAAGRGLARPTASWTINETQVKVMAWLKDGRDRQRTDREPAQPQGRTDIAASERERANAPQKSEPDLEP